MKKKPKQALHQHHFCYVDKLETFLLLERGPKVEVSVLLWLMIITLFHYTSYFMALILHQPQDFTNFLLSLSLFSLLSLSPRLNFFILHFAGTKTHIRPRLIIAG